MRNLAFILFWALLLVTLVLYLRAIYHNWLRKHDWWSWYGKFYMKSRHWKRYRKMRVKKAGHRCDMCGAKPPLHVHHLHYRSLGHERMNDTLVLCKRCHQDQHERKI